MATALVVGVIGYSCRRDETPFDLDAGGDTDLTGSANPHLTCEFN